MVYFSIITVNKNNASGLRKTIESVIEQTCKSFEFIIIDGKSTDESVDVIQKYRSKVSFWVSENDKGIYNAMNKGIKLASGEYCLFLNSGDYLFNKDILQDLADLKFGEDIVSGDVIKFSDFHTNMEVYSRIKHSSITLFDLYNSSLNHQATFIKRSLFDKYGLYEEKYSVISDWVFTIKTIILNNASFKYINRTISYYNEIGVSSCTGNYYLKERLPALNELIPLRILADYEINFNKEFLTIFNRIKKYKSCMMVLKILNYFTLKYETIFKKNSYS